MKTTLTTKLATAAAATGLALAAVVGAAGPAHAVDPVNTNATFTITPGALSITVPSTTVTYAAVNTGASTAGGALGSVAVTDTRGALLNSWTTTVTATDFLRAGGTATANETVTPANMTYASGAATASSAVTTGVFVPSTGLTAIGAGYTAGSWTGATGNNNAAWNPTVTFNLATSQVAGVYNGTVTHSLA